LRGPPHKLTAVPASAYILTALVSYLLGSIPTGFLVGKARGIDIRRIGSGNIGATNVFRTFGTVAGVAVLLTDALKGFLAVALVAWLCWKTYGTVGGTFTREWLEIDAGLAAVLGHNYTCWLHFKGGKGIATSAGVLLALVPYSLLIIFAIWILVLGLTRYVSLASICASFSLPFATWLTGRSSTLILITSAMTVLAIYKHKSNIQRLFNGTETRIGIKKAAPTPDTPKAAS
jgi:glycerol-3-phosphate acyltransferase PlsY